MSSEFRSSTHRTLQQQQWDKLALYQNPEESSNEVDETNKWLLGYILQWDIFPQDAYDTVQRLFGPLSAREWTNHIIDQWMTFDALECFLENHSIDLHTTPSITLFVLKHRFYDNENKEHLLTKLIEHGADVNEIEPLFGRPLLLSYVYHILHNQDDYDLLHSAPHLISFLLKKGANPLLLSKDGLTPIEYVETYIDHHYPNHNEFATRILTELKKYA